ncbi:MAG: hypothetical protein ABIQ39_13675 [Ilumatobacteraceae bacterium]
MSATKAPAKVVRKCSSCQQGLTLEQIIYSCEYPDKVLTRTGGSRKGTLADAERVWCGTDCAQATYELAQLGL